MDTNLWFEEKKPTIEVNRKLCPRRLIKEFSVRLDTTTPQNTESQRERKQP